MNIYYLDASAWVKRYYQELGTKWIQTLLAENLSIASATLGLIEVLATLARKRRSGEIEPNLYQIKLQEVDADWERFIQIQLTSEIVEISKSLTNRFALRGADAIHLASAFLLKERFVHQNDQLILVTSDLELIAAAQDSKMVVLDPSKQEGQNTLIDQDKQDE